MEEVSKHTLTRINTHTHTHTHTHIQIHTHDMYVQVRAEGNRLYHKSCFKCGGGGGKGCGRGLNLDSYHAMVSMHTLIHAHTH